MAIPVTTRTAKGSPLTRAEMDTNLTNLARSATEGLEGNIQIATSAETRGMASDNTAVPPAHLDQAIWGFIQTVWGNSTEDVSSLKGCYSIKLESSSSPLLLQWGSVTMTPVDLNPLPEYTAFAYTHSEVYKKAFTQSPFFCVIQWNPTNETSPSSVASIAYSKLSYLGTSVDKRVGFLYYDTAVYNGPPRKLAWFAIGR